MREYLFRGKRADNGEWVEGYYWQNKVGNHFIRVSSIEGKYMLIDYEVYPETVGQYTGLCDKNGKKIFEGDIVSSDSNSKFIIKWNNNKAKFVCAYVNKSEDYFGDYYCNLSDKYIKQNFNVIGNIHDNPELLEVEE